ncbi:type IV secretory system conjugative DNA transfer family protein [Agromyces cerinus]|uniref:AAA-like domain-containing protein n=1 Tax=Agromyces cerinus subsp. cerinus TaxID=232089 RepID=A0A1N6IET7_9MICO|nr:type IV secretory system conjugative DNA transfer family protein [Agromyces cerinus]SIO30518.1 hypothetical protein SAMN05443544_3956 [Agromyces cerinus subsp. cerinus]
MSNAEVQGAEPQGDATSELIGQLIAAAAVLVATLVLLPLLVPIVAVAIAGEAVAVKARFWVVWRWQWVLNTIGALLVAALVAVEVWLLAQWFSSGAGVAFFAADNWGAQLWPTFGPWVLVNLAAGVLLLPLAWSIHRRRIAERVRTRRISDVIRQTRIETARKRAADVAAARRIGVKLEASTGQIRGTTSQVVTVPMPAGDGRQAFGFITRPTVKTLPEKFYDVRQVRDWVDVGGKLAVLPKAASSVRALLLAESGTGKTVLLNGVMLCALEYGWPVVMLDAKGDPADAEALAEIARSYGRSAIIAGPKSEAGRAGWNLFSGNANQVTAKLMRLMPEPDGANQHYLDEIRGVLQAVQDTGPVRSVADLRDRLTNPGPWVRDQYDQNMVNQPVDRNGTTAGTRALQSLLVALRPLEEWLSEDGWSYEDRQADVTVVPLSPVDDAQARLGDLLMLDLRNYMATRLARRDKSPLLVVVDEFPQLVTGTSDPGDTAGSLFETARSAGMGLILAAQSPAGVSNDEVRRRRALTSGAALIFGRSKDPEDVVKYAGTVMQMEASGAAGGEQLNSARAQHTYVIPPQDVREATDGAFWIVQAGAIAPFRALPNRTVDPSKIAGTTGTPPAPADEPASPPVDVDQEPTPAEEEVSK